MGWGLRQHDLYPNSQGHFSPGTKITPIIRVFEYFFHLWLTLPPPRSINSPSAGQVEHITSSFKFSERAKPSKNEWPGEWKHWISVYYLERKPAQRTRKKRARSNHITLTRTPPAQRRSSPTHLGWWINIVARENWTGPDWSIFSFFNEDVRSTFLYCSASFNCLRPFKNTKYLIQFSGNINTQAYFTRGLCNCYLSEHKVTSAQSVLARRSLLTCRSFSEISTIPESIPSTVTEESIISVRTPTPDVTVTAALTASSLIQKWNQRTKMNIFVRKVVLMSL